MISFNTVKTALLLGALSGLLLFFGYWLGGSSGIVIAFVISIAINIITYFFSEQIVLRMYNAKALDRVRYRDIYDMVESLCKTMNMPMPKLWIMNSAIANAFATGRDPHHASVVVSTGILKLLNTNELRGVLAHELSHVQNRDILIGTVAATIATAIGYVAMMARYAAFWGDFGKQREQRVNPFAVFIMSLVLPIAATIIQLAISRSREYQADESGACHCKDPLALASALEKLENYTKEESLDYRNSEYATTSSLFIVKPFSGSDWIAIFSTHPPLSKRIARLRALAAKIQ